ncbi:peptidoglycan-binding domain-containing protein [Kitasatospora sp. NPDC049285]|uniref:peptidoglycan recognition protein family protein n=1 Tax=Kitasatospora sp. NPDC049285 TaxID=3157096 RepID=UPI00341B0320
MQLITRDQWGARPPKAQFTQISGTQGVKIHYEGTAVPSTLADPDQHGRCAARMRDLQASHQANTQEKYIDLAYSAVVCPHGFVFEGRGPGHLQAANGPGLNSAHYSVCAMLGDEGLTAPTTAQLGGLRDAIEWLRSAGGAGSEIKGHRDGYATDCPGEPLYRWVQAGAPRPDGTSTAPAPVTPPPAAGWAPAWPGRYLRNGSSGSDVRTWQQQMAQRGWAISVDGQFGPQSERIARAFQQEKGLQVDGVIGPVTWAAAWTAPVT